MKKKNVLKIILSVIVTFALLYLAIFGLKLFNKQIIKSAKNINTGLDISGGVSLVYQASTQNGKEITQDDLKKSEAVIRKRLEAKNIFDYIVRSDVSTNQISVEIPTDTTDKSKDPLKAVEGLDKTAKIEFRDPDSKVLLAGDDIKSASYSTDAVDNTGMPSPHVVLTFSEQGAKKFTEATGNLIGKTIGIYLDDSCITEPTVNSKIDSNTAIITMGQGTYAEKEKQAKEYTMLIDSGALPFELKVISKEYIGPYIGQKALIVCIYAAIISLVIIAIIMIVFYRLSGFVSTLALIDYVSLVLLIMTNSGTSLTLSGIAGLILSIGMAVDANVIIFERLKEELAKKLAPTKAFEKSFKHAMSSIIDGNITTFIIAILLYIFGIGSVKGFGITLAIGVVTSLFTAVIITKYVLKQFLPLASKSTFLFGIKKEVNVDE